MRRREREREREREKGGNVMVPVAQGPHWLIPPSPSSLQAPASKREGWRTSGSLSEHVWPSLLLPPLLPPLLHNRTQVLKQRYKNEFFFATVEKRGEKIWEKKMGVEKLLISTDFEKRFHVGERERRGKQRSVIFRSDLLFCETGWKIWRENWGLLCLALGKFGGKELPQTYLSELCHVVPCNGQRCQLSWDICWTSVDIRFNTILDGSTFIPDKKCLTLLYKNLYWIVKNGAGYHPGSSMLSTTDGTSWKWTCTKIFNGVWGVRFLCLPGSC